MVPKPLAVNQALYGYQRGHRLLASSIELSPVSQRSLRSVTDTSFEGSATSYLTIVPLPEDNVQAFATTWPADEGRRPGSVWSHVLLVAFTDIGRTDGLAGLADAFAMPDADSEESGFASYRQAVLVAPDERIASPLDPKLAAVAVSALYGSDVPVSVVASDQADASALLLRLWEQQWPKLRRQTASRARRRPADRPTVRFDLEVVERPSRVRDQVAALDAAWVHELVRDLQSPNPDLRRFLQAFGAESTRGRTDMRPFVELAMAVAGDPPPEVVRQLANAYPNPTDMRGLKQALLGADDRVKSFAPWVLPESVRLGLLLRSGSAAFDLAQLCVTDRVREGWSEHPGAMVNALSGVELSRLQPSLAESVVSTTASAASLDAIATLAAANRDFGEQVLRRRPDVLGNPEFWSAADDWELMIDLLGESETAVRAETFVHLVSAGMIDAASAVCALEPAIWWAAVIGAGRPSDGIDIRTLSQSLGAVLDRVGPAAIGRSPVGRPDRHALQLVATTADPKHGLWRQFPAETWLREAEAIRGDRIAPEVRGRILTLSLLATAAGPSALRSDSWERAFWPLHTLLAEGQVDQLAWAMLAETLPAGSEWDRCQRLRRGLVEEVRRDRWAPDRVEAVLSAAPEWRRELIDAVKALEPPKKKKKKKSWWREIVDSIVP